MVKKIICFLFIICFVPLFALDLNLSYTEKEYLRNIKEIKVQAESDWAPYNFIQNDVAMGFTNDYLREIEKILNIKISFVKGYSWSEYLAMLENNQIDMISNMAITSQRSQKFIFSDNTIFGTYKSLFFMQNSRYKKLEDLNNKKLGLVNGYYEEEIIKQNYPHIKIHIFKNNQKLIEGLLNKEVDAIIGNDRVLRYILNDNFFNNIDSTKILNEYFPLKSIHFAFSKENHILKSIMDKAILALEEDRKKELRNKWSLDMKAHHLLDLKEEEYLASSEFTIYYNEKGWLPFIFFEEERVKGISADFWDEIVKDTPIKFKYESFESFSKILELVKVNPNAILTSTSFTKERESYASFTKPYASFPIGIATNIKEDFILDFKELEGKKVAVGKNYSAHKLLEKYYPKIDFVPVTNIQTALSLLARGEVYAVADIVPVLNFELNRYGFTNLKISGTSEFKFDIQIMVNKQNSQLVPILNKLIDAMDLHKKDEIINRWLHQKTTVSVLDYTFAYWIAGVALLIIIFILYRQKILMNQKKEVEKEVKLATQNLVELNKIYEETQKLARIGTIKKDFKTSNYWATKEFFNIFELQESSVLNNEMIRTKVHEEDRVRFEKIFLNNQQQDCEDEHILLRLKIEDRLKYLDILVSCSFDENGIEIERKATVQDVTEKINAEHEKKRQEEVFIQQSKLASMGEMIGAIAHQWRQPLNELSIRIQKLKYKYAKNEIDEAFITEFIEKNKKTIDFMSKTIDDFRNFFRIDKEKREFNIKQSLEEVVNIVAAQLKNHNIEIELTGEDFYYNGFKTEFQQVILNLISNSKDALVMNNIKEPKISIVITNKGVQIEDNGGGIDSEVISRIFEPYFTTKQQGEGTGMGLYMSKMIIEDNMNGKIEAMNQNQGLLVSISLGEVL